MYTEIVQTASSVLKTWAELWPRFLVHPVYYESNVLERFYVQLLLVLAVVVCVVDGT